ncbi:MULTISPECIES: acyltransferase [unclassified Streptomyces]|uniref:acyltransferase family protein n=1 Tax=unclassified Streptomyces TaxID=2593676 RepID=UPI0022587B8E|nr:MULTISPECIES: acyltransferase [unclassified Streptomyces]MCX4527126.1 acyltransferase [Streptomyces sp. NBC_01551]MCX4542298.1 acyltransferase [Streptomyces sp. NBC_01565]
MAELRARWSALADRVEARTPAGRDRSVDALRALAILGVVLGHWLVTALTTADGGLSTTSPLAHMSPLAPVSWVFQTLSVFFLVGGHVGARGLASARERGVPYRVWVGQRLSRLFRPVAAVLGLWSVTAGGMLLGGVELGTVHTLLTLVLSPLWFLLVFAALTAATPLVARLHPVAPLAVVAGVDVWRFGFGGAPGWLGWINVAAGWLVPYTLGAAWSRGAFARRTPAALLLGGGVLATAALVLWGGYPASMVGVPGAAISNLNPPTLAAVAFGLAQCGLALLVREPLARAMRRPTAWAKVALVNLSAMTIFLWHQTALMAVTALGLLAPFDLPGLHTVPDSPRWIAARLLWLPVFAAALGVCWAAFRTYEQASRRPKPSRSTRTAAVPRPRTGPAKEINHV